MMVQHDPFGILAFLHWNHKWNRFHFPLQLLPKAVQQLKDLGVSFVRLDVLWNDVQPKDTFNFERYDPIVSLLKENNIKILGLLQYNKQFDTWNKPPSDLNAFTHYVKTTVEHFKSKISFWEVWNEPNHPQYWDAPRDNMKRFCQLLQASYQAIKDVDPTCTVLNGGITEPLIDDITNFYKQGGKDFTDILAIHTFVDPLGSTPLEKLSDLVQRIQKIKESFDDKEKKIWITEVGCPGVPSGLGEKTWFAGSHMTEDQQADWVEKLYRHIWKEPLVEKVFWAFYRDTDGEFKDGTDHLGLVRLNLDPKPSYKRLKTLTQEWAAATGSSGIVNL